MGAAWYYVKDEQQVGPVSGEQLKQLATSGQLAPGDLVWKDGMADWVPASRIKGLFDHARAAAPGSSVAEPVARPESPATTPMPVAEPVAPAGGYAPQAAQPIAYYNPTANLGGRAARVLAGFPPPTGPANEWPLSDVQLGQLAVAESHRKHIRALQNLLHALFVLCAIFAPLILLGALFTMADGGRNSGEAGVMMLLCALGIGGFGALYFFAARATRRCRIWGGVVLIVFSSLSLLMNLVSMVVVTSMARGPAAGVIIAPLIGCILPGAFLFIGIKGVAAIPRFLAAPIWAQEALVNAKL